MKRLLAIILAACMLLVLLVGCVTDEVPPAQDTDVATGETAPTEETATDDGDAPAPPAANFDPYGPLSERITLNIGRPETPNVMFEPGEDSFNNYVVRFLSEQLNIDYYYAFSTDEANAGYEMRVSMQIAAGDIPDVMTVTYAQLRQLVQADMIDEVGQTWENFASPAIRQAFESTHGVSKDLATFDGRLMAIPSMFPGMDTVPILFVRGDWMDELGLDSPETIEDIANITLAFREHNPGGNVTAGFATQSNIISTGGGVFHLNGFFNALDAFPRTWHWGDDGDVAYGSVQPEMREALLVVRDLVDRGVIDPGFAVRDSQQNREMVFSGQSGIFFGAWWTTQFLMEMLLAHEEEEGVRWDMYLVPLSAEGQVNAVMRNPSPNFVVIREGSSELVHEAVMKTLNWQYFLDLDQALGIRPDGMNTRFSWRFFPINTLIIDFDSKEVQIQSVMDAIDGLKTRDELWSGDGKTWYDGYTAVMEHGLHGAADISISHANAWGWARGAWLVQNNENMINRIWAATYAESPTMEARWGTLLTMEDEVFLRILTGEADISEFDDFVTQWHALGGDDIIRELTEIARSN